MTDDEDPLDLFDDDGDGVIETILLLDDEEEKPVLQRKGCAVLLVGVGSSFGIGWWAVTNYFT